MEFDKKGLNVIINRNLLEGLQRKFGDFKKETRQIVEDVLKEESALTAREAMVYTPPMDGAGGGKGDTKTAEKWGNMAVEKDILSVVSYENKALSAAVGPNGNSRKFADWKSGKRPKKSGIIQKIYDDNNFGRAYNKAKQLLSHNTKLTIYHTQAQIKQEHDSKRQQYRGRIRKNGGGKGIPVLANPKQLQAYIKLRQQRVGYMKAGWLDAIRKIGPANINGMPKNFGVKDLPSFITRHPNGHGQVGIQITSGTGGRSAIIIKNNIGNVFKVADMANTYFKVIQARSGKMKRRMQHFQRAAIEKFKNKKS
jgi:hypothetical protein